MQKFPKLFNNQVALLRAEHRTGHVLDEEYRLATTDAQIVYTVFECLSDAVNFVRTQSKINNNIEYVVYDSKNCVLEYIAPEKGK